jgi:rhamnogalacturonan endolyase
MKYLFTLAFINFCALLNAQQINYSIDKLLFEDNFSFKNDNWVIEKNKADSEKVTVTNGKLLIDTYGGATVWYKQELKGNILINFKRKIVMDSCKNCRLSDLNQFFMATEPNENKLFKRKGGFTEYDSLNMYYVGMGGNYNSTTRFRKYNNGDKKIIQEYNDAAHLLQANKEYLIEIIYYNGLIKFMVDKQEYFSWKDEQPFTHGYFAIRSTRSKQEISDLKIYQLK